MSDPDFPERLRQGLNLTTSAAFLDFDGTITIEDVSNHLLARLVPGQWEAIDALYENGSVGSRENLAALWQLLPESMGLLRSVAQEISLDPGFDSLLEFLTSAGSEVTVVSDGFGFYVDDMCQGRVPVMTNRVVDNRMEFPYSNADCACARCGTCKPAPIRNAGTRGQTTIFIGDGVSDRFAAQEADIVFAKGHLSEWCLAEGIAHVRFAELGEVESVLRSAVISPNDDLRRLGVEGPEMALDDRLTWPPPV